MSNHTITAPRGFEAGAAMAGIKHANRLDVGVIASEVPCTAAAVFTRNRFCGAPVIVGREHTRDGCLHAVVVNSGCSNVATGRRGVADARAMCRRVAEGIGVDETDVLPSSTGVIGQFLPMDKILKGIDRAVEALSGSARAGLSFARAIMTTDLKVKQATARFKIGKEIVTVAGCCKGSGMIAPNMATMLAYLTTDAGVPAARLRTFLKAAIEPTFNRVTVDECESTSDTVTIMASGLALPLDSRKAEICFAVALGEVCESLAYQIAADGEGATRVLEVSVTGAKTHADAHAAARTIAVSPLVKTAVHGGDPNWGRIVQALGQTRVAYQPERVVIRLDKTTLFRKGAPAPGLDKRKLSRMMLQRHVSIAVDLGAGKACDRVLTCDLSRDYIKINADYTT
ncbi:MAG: bifunctional glutamate N-acetyltransferase/amino-acid acetyltransferase ArgJ [Phycisphaerae bacterium]|nr:bifunctional glutamate N-acetyltransferase/amino-acid acetyltransferase ArgJ [Phycisphaerae bacterium]